MQKTPYRVACVLGGLCLAVMFGNVSLAMANKSLQAELAVRQQYVQQSVQLEGLYREIARALAELGQRNNDHDVKAMLERHGISFQASAANPSAVRK